VINVCYNEENNPHDLSEDEIYQQDEDEIYYKSLEDKLREVGMSINDFI
jgi:hypothetical protein